MSTWETYFGLMGLLLVFYVLLRLAIGWDYRWQLPKSSRGSLREPAGQGIDTSALSGRVEQLREDFHNAAAKPTVSFKKPLLIEERRRELAKRDYFQKPPAPEPEPPEHEGGVTLLFI